MNVKQSKRLTTFTSSQAWLTSKELKTFAHVSHGTRTFHTHHMFHMYVAHDSHGFPHMFHMDLAHVSHGRFLRFYRQKNPIQNTRARRARPLYKSR